MAEFIPALALDQLPSQGFKAVEVAGKPLLIGRAGGQLFACLDRCPHAAAPLRIGKLRGEELQCAWHGWTFNVLSGQPVPGDPSFTLTTVPAKIENGQVLVCL
jgi:nitrite reductase/ring-hydroxylating ferredoxin subunit